MQKYRSGDQVLLEIPAIVIAAADGFVRVRFGEIEYEAEQNSLVMIKRSMHLGDEIVHDGREGKLSQNLEDGVFLVHYVGASGAQAYGVAAIGDLHHADRTEAPAATPPERHAASAPATEAGPAKAAAAAPAPAEPVKGSVAEPEDDDTLELTQPVVETKSGEELRRAGAGVSEMSSSLSGVLDRGGQRRQPLDLESLGTTETVRDVRSEMVLGDDMRLQGGSD